MLKNRVVSVAAIMGLTSLASAQQTETITEQLGNYNDQTQGVVTIYGADWCEPCKRLKKEIETSELIDKLTREGIVFTFVENIYNEKEKKRVNEHLKNNKELNGIPYIKIYDLGKSFPGDKPEVTIRGIRKAHGLEKYIQRYALDQEVSMLEEEETTPLLEALASGLFNITYGKLDETRVGFTAIPKNINDPHTQQEMARLHIVANGLQIMENYILEQRETSKKLQRKPATFEEAQRTQEELEKSLAPTLQANAKTLKEYYNNGPLHIPEEFKDTHATKAYKETGRLVVLERRVPTEQEIEALTTAPEYNGFLSAEKKELYAKQTELKTFYNHLANRNIIYVPSNSSFIPQGPAYIEGQLDQSSREELKDESLRVWIQQPIANVVTGPQTHGIAGIKKEIVAKKQR